MVRQACLTLVAVVSLGCRAPERTPTGPNATVAINGVVTARRSESGVLVANGKSVSISFHVTSTGWLGLLAPCTHAQAGCTQLAAGASTVVPESKINGYDPAMRSVTVAFWQAGKEGHEEVVFDW